MHAQFPTSCACTICQLTTFANPDCPACKTSLSMHCNVHVIFTRQVLCVCCFKLCCSLMRLFMYTDICSTAVLVYANYTSLLCSFAAMKLPMSSTPVAQANRMHMANHARTTCMCVHAEPCMMSHHDCCDKPGFCGYQAVTSSGGSFDQAAHIYSSSQVHIIRAAAHNAICHVDMGHTKGQSSKQNMGKGLQLHTVCPLPKSVHLWHAQSFKHNHF